MPLEDASLRGLLLYYVSQGHEAWAPYAPDDKEHGGKNRLQKDDALQAEALEDRHHRLRHHGVVPAEAGVSLHFGETEKQHGKSDRYLHVPK